MHKSCCKILIQFKKNWRYRIFQFDLKTFANFFFLYITSLLNGLRLFQQLESEGGRKKNKLKTTQLCLALKTFIK